MNQVAPTLLQHRSISMNEKLSTIVFRDWSVLSLFPGMNSSKPTTSDHGESRVHGDRLQMVQTSWRSDGDSARRVCNNLPGSMKCHTQSVPSFNGNREHAKTLFNSALVASLILFRSPSTVIVSAPVATSNVANPCTVTPPR